MVAIRHGLFTLIVGLSVLSNQSPAQTQKIAFVLEKAGPWQVANKPAQIGLGLLAGQVLRLDTSLGKPGSITILYINGEKSSCPSRERPKDCTDLPVQSPAPQAHSSIFARVFGVLQEAFSSDSASVPGLNKAASIPDGYAELGGKGILILVPESSADKQSLRLQFRRLGESGKVGPPVLPDAPWIPGTPLAIDLKPGFYRVNLLNSDMRPSGDFFMLLVVPSGRGKRLDEDLNALLGKSDRWGEEEQATALMVRRMFLWQTAKNMGLLTENR